MNQCRAQKVDICLMTEIARDYPCMTESFALIDHAPESFCQDQHIVLLIRTDTVQGI